MQPAKADRFLYSILIDLPKCLEAAKQPYRQLALPFYLRGLPFLFKLTPIPKRMLRSIGRLLPNFKV
ncbi:MAG: hypothetical protein CMI16_13570 [Opitutaceae bacterium]|nr:hypothetical protein [Opitutaceae bacterium]